MTESLRPYAVGKSNTRGRARNESSHPYRDDFDRDRDRIIHCQAFRRLEGKTQVFTPGLNDNYRTRLTHSLEVAQIGRTIARVLGLNESLTEAICLGHDLGHCPFGHAGEEVLNELMAEYGGFEHNCQTLRIVDTIEHPYVEFAGLNLMYETRLGFSKHSGLYDHPQGVFFQEQSCSLEGQIADLADSVAYNCHDLEDGLRARLIEEGQLSEIELFNEARQKINACEINDRVTRRTRIAKTIIDILVGDCIEHSQKAIKQAGIDSLEDVYAGKENLISLSPPHHRKLKQLQIFLYDNFYRHHDIAQAAPRIRSWLEKLFEAICKNTELMPRYYREFIADEGLERTVCDYIAGMTDRYCLKTLAKIRQELL